MTKADAFLLATNLVNQYGDVSNDFFKSMELDDKLSLIVFENENGDSFVFEIIDGELKENEI